MLERHVQSILDRRARPLIDEITLCQRQLLARLSSAMHPIRLDSIRLRVDLHLRPHIVELHVALADIPAIPDGLDALP